MNFWPLGEVEFADYDFETEDLYFFPYRNRYFPFIIFK